MCGIFAYINHGVVRDRKFILETLVNGLKRLEYRGYDSAGVAVDGHMGEEKVIPTVTIKQRGKVKALEDKIFSSDKLDLEETFTSHTGIAHTRWATHGIPNEVNSHPQRSCENNDFVIIHNGIITNYKTIKTFLESHNYQFESDTDTEVIAKLIKYLWDNREKENISFITLVERVIQQLEGAFALVFKSRLFPGQCVACKRGSPMVIGISSRSKLSTDNIPIMYSSYKPSAREANQQFLEDLGTAMTFKKKNQTLTASMSNLCAETDAQRQNRLLKNDLARHREKIAEKYKRKSSLVETFGKRQRLDHSLLNTCDLDLVYTNLMMAVDKKGSLENFRKNKPLMKLISEQNHTANMNKDEEKKFYEGVYKCPLFIKD